MHILQERIKEWISWGFNPFLPSTESVIIFYSKPNLQNLPHPEPEAINSTKPSHESDPDEAGKMLKTKAFKS